MEHNNNKMKTKNLNSLGTEYNIVDPDGELIRKIKIIQQQDILSCAVGEYSKSMYQEPNEYVRQSVKRLTGFAKSPLDVYWHKTTPEEYELMEVVEICIQQKYNYAIIEIVNPTELDRQH